MVDELGLVGKIDALIPQDLGQRQVSLGVAVKAMILNGLGFAHRALYLTPHFFRDKPVGRLLGPGITAEPLNDDTLGRALDAIHAFGVEAFYDLVASDVVGQLGLGGAGGHLDATRFHVDGDHNSGDEAAAEGVIHSRQGDSRDRRPDLNQAVPQWLVESQAGIPLPMAPLGGNANDQAGFRDTVAAHVGQLQANAGPRHLVADSALYNAETLRALGGTVWISRVPETLGAAREILLAVAGDLMRTEEASACRAVGVVDAGIRQRWRVVFSREARQRAEQTPRRRHLRRGEAEPKAFDTLCRQGFACETDARAALDAFAKGLKLTAVAEGRVAARTRPAKQGRPAKGQEPGVVSHAIKGPLASRPDIHARRSRQKSAFIIATNDISDSILSDEQVVEAYKKDQRKVERGFRFLKDPLFMASTLFLKSPKRIMALMAVMTLCLMVHAALEHRIRQGLAEHRQTFPDQKGHPAECPTARWVFQFFTGIHVLLVGQITEVVLNLNTHHQTLLAILGEHYVDLYANSG